jgi:hypothetical protein
MATDGGSGNVEFVEATTDKNQGGNLAINVPPQTKRGDLLLLFVHRTDGPNLWTLNEFRASMPGSSGWNGPLATCAIDNVAGDFDCGGQQGDLNQVIYHKRATASDLGARLDLDMPGSKPAWAVMAAIRGATTSATFTRTIGYGTPQSNGTLNRCDQTGQTRFAPVPDARQGDLLLLSQSFDDGANSPNSVEDNDFEAPLGLSRYAYVIDNDEAGHLFGGLVTNDGGTPMYTTTGDGAAHCKDLAISIAIIPE